MKVLLVEPDYYTRYPPLGLLKISRYHRQKGDSIEFIRVKASGLRKPRKQPDIIYVTSLFTWAWKPVWRSVIFYKRVAPNSEVWLGGLYASLMSDHARLSGADVVHSGLFDGAEEIMPDYRLVPEWDGSIVFSSRGCNRACPFCAVPRLEGKLDSAKGSIKDLVYPRHTRIVLWDNNFLQSPHWRDICVELKDIGRWVDFNQGLDGRLITDDVASYLGRLKLDSRSSIKIRLAYDGNGTGPRIEKAISCLEAVGIRKRAIMVYVLFNYGDDPDDFLDRVRNVLNWGAVAYPMRYEPLDALVKNKYVDPRWTVEDLEMVQDARRVLGYGGAFPPYRALVEKLNRSKSFNVAFSLRSPRR